MSEMVAFFIEPLTKILISHFIGIREVGFFDIALKVKAQFQGHSATSKPGLAAGMG